MSVETVARRYASALADVVMKNGESETVRAELKQWEDLIRSNKDLETAFNNPAIAHLNKEKVLEQLIEKVRPSKTTANFMRVLLSNSRIDQLPEVNERFETELEERRGIISADVISARELSEAEKTELKASIEKLTGKPAHLSFTTDKNLIGGVVTRIGSTVYDGSVRTRLENLREALIQG